MHESEGNGEKYFHQLDLATTSVIANDSVDTKFPVYFSLICFFVCTTHTNNKTNTDINFMANTDLVVRGAMRAAIFRRNGTIVATYITCTVVFPLFTQESNITTTTKYVFPAAGS